MSQDIAIRSPRSTDTQPLRSVAVPDAPFSPTAHGDRCRHCDQPLPAHARSAFCCLGCRAVHQALQAGGLLRYYELRDRPDPPVGDLHLERRDYKWLSPLTDKVARAADAADVSLSVQGVRCAACVWLIQELFRQQPGARAVLLNPGTGRLAMTVTPAFPLQRFVTGLEQLGYVLGQASATGGTRRSDDLRLRAGLCTAFALNAMMFSVAIYLGLPQGPLRSFLHDVNFALTVLAVLVGAPVFVSQALSSLRSRVLHLDLPIAAGISLSAVAAVWAFVSGYAQAAYYDSLAVFVALMLWGRYLQDRVIERNRAQLLPYEADHGLMARRVTGTTLADVPAREVAADDLLWLSPGDLAPVEVQLERGPADFSLDWIRGEPEPVRFGAGDTVPAGAVNTGGRPALVRARQDYASSALLDLLAAPQVRPDRPTGHKARFAPAYVVAVLGAAVTAFVVTWLRNGRIAPALASATAVCVVSCPCSVGLAVPLAQELVLSKLRRIGLFVRDPSFLQRAATVDAVAFDKTGTLTTGFLEVSNLEALHGLSPHARRVLYGMVAGNAHPHALSIRRTIERLHPAEARLPDVDLATEVVGEGIECAYAGQRYRLGRADWACEREGEPAGGATVFSCDGQPLGGFVMREVPRPAVVEECRKLRALGCRLYVISGDAPAPVHALARRLGIRNARVFAGQRPADKAALMAQPEHDRTLMLGDGINDNLALQCAYAAGTPSLDRPAVTTRADFYYVAPGLAPITAGLRAARDLRRLQHSAYGFFAVYNAAAVAAAVLGAIQPWTAAVIMPLSSMVSVGAVYATVERRSQRWTS